MRKIRLLLDQLPYASFIDGRNQKECVTGSLEFALKKKFETFFKQTEPKPSAPTLTVCSILADKINGGAAPADVVTEAALRNRAFVEVL